MKKFTFVFLLISAKSFAQTTHQYLYWTRYLLQTNLSKKTFLVNEIDNRVFFKGNIQHHTIQHNHVHFKIRPNMDVAAGLTLSWQSPQSPESISKLKIPEIRPFQEFNFSKKLKNNMGFSYRFRLDERFIKNNNGTELLDGYNFNFRIRNRFQIQKEIWKIGNAKSGILKLSDELMLNAGKAILYNKFDQNRIYFGLEQTINKNFSAEIGYLNWYQHQNQKDKFYQRNIVRITLYHKINLSKN